MIGKVIGTAAVIHCIASLAIPLASLKPNPERNAVTWIVNSIMLKDTHTFNKHTTQESEIPPFFPRNGKKCLEVKALSENEKMELFLHLAMMQFRLHRRGIYAKNLFKNLCIEKIDNEITFSINSLPFPTVFLHHHGTILTPTLQSGLVIDVYSDLLYSLRPELRHYLLSPNLIQSRNANEVTNTDSPAFITEFNEETKQRFYIPLNPVILVENALSILKANHIHFHDYQGEVDSYNSLKQLSLNKVAEHMKQARESFVNQIGNLCNKTLSLPSPLLQFICTGGLPKEPLAKTPHMSDPTADLDFMNWISFYRTLFPDMNSLTFESILTKKIHILNLFSAEFERLQALGLGTMANNLSWKRQETLAILTPSFIAFLDYLQVLEDSFSVQSKKRLTQFKTKSFLHRLIGSWLDTNETLPMMARFNSLRLEKRKDSSDEDLVPLDNSEGPLILLESSEGNAMESSVEETTSVKLEKDCPLDDIGSSGDYQDGMNQTERTKSCTNAPEIEEPQKTEQQLFEFSSDDETITATSPKSFPKLVSQHSAPTIPKPRSFKLKKNKTMTPAVRNEGGKNKQKDPHRSSLTDASQRPQVDPNSNVASLHMLDLPRNLFADLENINIQRSHSTTEELEWSFNPLINEARFPKSSPLAPLDLIESQTTATSNHRLTSLGLSSISPLDRKPLTATEDESSMPMAVKQKVKNLKTKRPSLKYEEVNDLSKSINDSFDDYEPTVNKIALHQFKVNSNIVVPFSHHEILHENFNQYHFLNSQIEAMLSDITMYHSNYPKASLLESRFMKMRETELIAFVNLNQKKLSEPINLPVLIFFSVGLDYARSIAQNALEASFKAEDLMGVICPEFARYDDGPVHRLFTHFYDSFSPLLSGTNSKVFAKLCKKNYETIIDKQHELGVIQTIMKEGYRLYEEDNNFLKIVIPHIASFASHKNLRKGTAKSNSVSLMSETSTDDLFDSLSPVLLNAKEIKTLFEHAVQAQEVLRVEEQ